MEAPDDSDPIDFVVKALITALIREGLTRLAKALENWFKNHPKATKPQLMDWINEQVSIPESVVAILNADDPLRKKRIQ